MIRGERGREALTALDSIGDLLRTSLDAGGEQFVPLARELELTRRYLAVEELRLGDRLRVTIEAEPLLEQCEVPAFITQPLVENAMKHGIAARTEGGSICVSARRGDAPGTLIVDVTDDGSGFDARSKAKRGVGIRHIEERLTALFDDAAHLEYSAPETGGTRARLVLPLEDDEAPEALA